MKQTPFLISIIKKKIAELSLPSVKSLAPFLNVLGYSSAFGLASFWNNSGSLSKPYFRVTVALTSLLLNEEQTDLMINCCKWD